MQHLRRLKLVLRPLTIENFSILDLEMASQLCIKQDAEKYFLTVVLSRKSLCLLTSMYVGIL